MYTKLRLSHKVLIEFILVIFAFLWLYPLVQAILKSLNVNGLGNYVQVLTNPRIDVTRTILNSFFIAISTCVIVTTVVTLGAYAFSKMRFPLKNFIYYGLLICLTIPAASVMTPLFFTVKRLGLMNTYMALVLPMAAFQAPFLLLILKNYFDTIPNDLLESSTIDGANSIQALRMIVMPLGKPALINIIVLSFVSSWNEYFIPLLFVSNRKMYTVTLATSFYTGTQFQSPEMVAQLYATLILMTVPSIVIYFFSQRYMQEGLTAGALKG